jgi:hypothetical protein
MFNVQPQAILSAEDKGVVAQFFISTASNLAVYVMLLVGLQMGATANQGGVP